RHHPSGPCWSRRPLNPRELHQFSDHVGPAAAQIMFLSESAGYRFLPTGAAAQGVTFSPSILDVSVSIVSINGLAVNALGTPCHWNCACASGLPVSGLSSFSVISAGASWPMATVSSFGRHAGFAETRAPFNCGTLVSFSDDAKYCS